MQYLLDAEQTDGDPVSRVYAYGADSNTAIITDSLGLVVKFTTTPISGTTPQPPIPEPSTVLLLGAGLLGLGAFRRKLKK
jgi:hypothetical protein